MLRPRTMGIMDYIERLGADLITPPQASPVMQGRSPLQMAMNRPEVQFSQPNASVMGTTMPSGSIAMASPTPEIQAEMTGAGVRGPRMNPPQVTPTRPQQSPMRDMGGSGVRMTQDQLASQAAQLAKLEERNPRVKDDPKFIDTVTGFFGNRQNMLRLAAGFNSMRLNPDQGLASLIGTELKDISERKTTQQAATRTAQVLRESNPRLAALLEQGVIDAKTATTIAYKNPSQIDQMIELLETNPDQFKQLAQAGAFGGDVDMGQGAFADAQAKSIIERTDAIRNNATQARTLMSELARFDQILQSNPDIQTGPLEARMQALREFGASIGVPVDQARLGAGQTLNAAAFNLVANELRKNKGPQTDFDAEFTARFVPSLGNTPQANRQILDYMNSANKIMTIHGSMLTGLPSNISEAREQVVKIEDSQMNTPAAIKVDNTWLSFDEFYKNAKQQARRDGLVVSDIEIMNDWKEQAAKY
jgi:hypothetical protein